MRRKAKVDENQGLIVDLFRKAGLSVAITSGAGDGFPDLVLGAEGAFPFGGLNLLVEVKDGNKVPSKRHLTQKQQEFHAGWKGQITIVETAEQAEQLVNEIRRAGW